MHSPDPLYLCIYLISTLELSSDVFKMKRCIGFHTLHKRFQNPCKSHSRAFSSDYPPQVTHSAESWYFSKYFSILVLSSIGSWIRSLKSRASAGIHGLLLGRKSIPLIFLHVCIVKKSPLMKCCIFCLFTM